MKFFRRFVIALAVVLLILNGLPFLLPVPSGTVDPQTLASPIGQFIRVDGVSIYVEQAGPDDGTPLILLHGLFGSTFTWRNQLTGLGEAGYRVIAYDRPPFGRPPFGLSAKDFVLNYSSAAQADQLASLSAGRTGNRTSDFCRSQRRWLAAGTLCCSACRTN